MHQRNTLTFWQHHMLTTMIAIPLLSIARLIGRLAEIGDAPNIILHSAVLICFSHPITNLGAYGAMRYMPRRVPLAWRAIAGCVLIAPVSALLSPILSWFVGVGPPPIIGAANREELTAVVADRYFYILAGYAVLGTMMWMALNFSWWRRALAEGEASERLVEEAGQPEAPERASVPSAGRPQFLSKMPFAKRGELWALSSELHYVRVHTSRGSDLVLMRLSDAMQQAEGVEGLQIHRSHWVAREGIASISVTDGKMSVVLKNETELPVSRSYQGAVRNTFADLID